MNTKVSRKALQEAAISRLYSVCGARKNEECLHWTPLVTV
jgi:hypothetical protein